MSRKKYQKIYLTAGIEGEQKPEIKQEDSIIVAKG
jgi:DNA-directed RNA polymerase subunit H (RpoH/RPB5)